MGRECKRVAANFNWPINTIWKGYLNPYGPTRCGACEGSGYNPETKKLADGWYNEPHYNGWFKHITQDEVQALVDAGRLMNFTRVPRNEEQKEIVRKKVEAGGNSWLPEQSGYIPTAEEVNAWAAARGLGHDCINRWICIETRAKRLGVYGMCGCCNGKGHVWCEDKYEELYQNWERIEPPEGEGFQLWETTSEGSPISPVFESAEDLAHWLADTGASSFGSDTATYEQWLNMINAAWAPSLVHGGKGLQSGVEACSDD